MKFDDLIGSITPDIYAKLQRAIEIGKWENGEPLTPEQREQCLQAVIAYGHKNLGETERIGYIAPKEHTHCGSDGDKTDHEWQTLKLVDE